VRTTGARFGLNMMFAVSARGALRFSVLAGTRTAANFIAFLQRLRHDAAGRGGGPVFCIAGRDHQRSPGPSGIGTG
jgi:hypothetical protein